MDGQRLFFVKDYQLPFVRVCVFVQVCLCAWEGEGIGSPQLILFVGNSTAWKWISIRTGRTWIANMDTPFAFPVKETLFVFYELQRWS